MSMCHLSPFTSHPNQTITIFTRLPPAADANQAPQPAPVPVQCPYFSPSSAGSQHPWCHSSTETLGLGDEELHPSPPQAAWCSSPGQLTPLSFKKPLQVSCSLTPSQGEKVDSSQSPLVCWGCHQSPNKFSQFWDRNLAV